MKRTSEKFVINHKLNKAELDLLANFIGKKVSRLLIIRGIQSGSSFNKNLDFDLEVHQELGIELKDPKSDKRDLFTIAPFFEENRLLVEQGGLFIEHIDDFQIPYSMPVLYGKTNFTIVYPINSNIKSVHLYGNYQKGMLSEFGPDYVKEYWEELGYKSEPEIDINSIEFLVLVHEDNQCSVFMVSNSLTLRFTTLDKLPDFLEENYLRINHCKKNIVLQHEIK